MPFNKTSEIIEANPDLKACLEWALRIIYRSIWKLSQNDTYLVLYRAKCKY